MVHDCVEMQVIIPYVSVWDESVGEVLEKEYAMKRGTGGAISVRERMVERPKSASVAPFERLHLIANRKVIPCNCPYYKQRVGITK